MGPQYLEPTRAGWFRLLLWAGAFVLCSGTLLFVADVYDRRQAELIEDFAAADAYGDIVGQLSPILFEVAVVRALVFGVIAGWIAWLTIRLRRVGQWPLPGAPVLFRTRIRTEPRYIKTAVILGYAGAAVTAINGLLGFYTWYLLR